MVEVLEAGYSRVDTLVHMLIAVETAAEESKADDTEEEECSGEAANMTSRVRVVTAPPATLADPHDHDYQQQ
jgi:hypothetical protein